MIQKYQLEIKNAYGIRKNKHLIERRRKFVKDDDDDVLKISDQDVELGSLDIHVIDKPIVKLDDSFLLNDVEILT